ncbi:hypothetical protein [Cupriavidus metallidurans]|uniref:hypothetical protein n=1 Tax=Cupriavidus metallidurans TaxID=119219 RepID=UPI0035C66AF2
MAEKLDLDALEAEHTPYAHDLGSSETICRLIVRLRALESASQPGIDALATAMHHAAIKYASGDLVDFQHEAREFLLASQPGSGEAVETLMMLMRANPNAYVSDILPHAEDYLARAASSAGNGEAKGDKGEGNA